MNKYETYLVNKPKTWRYLGTTARYFESTGEQSGWSEPCNPLYFSEWIGARLATALQTGDDYPTPAMLVLEDIYEEVDE